MASPPNYPEQTLHLATETLRAIAHPLRMQIIDYLASEGKLSVKQIHEAFGIQQPVASHHLRILKDKQIVESERDGQLTFYYLSKVGYQSIVKQITDLV
ncbi:MAG: metalloregulator ArsR/SmtB family transcription factor [Bacteroidota bacterium]